MKNKFLYMFLKIANRQARCDYHYTAFDEVLY